VGGVACMCFALPPPPPPPPPLTSTSRAGHLRITDFLHPDRVKLTGVLFSAMFNLTKFQMFEGRDPVLVKQELNLQGVTQWDRFASVEYTRLASEEEEATNSASATIGGGGDGGGGSLSMGTSTLIDGAIIGGHAHGGGGGGVNLGATAHFGAGGVVGGASGGVGAGAGGGSGGVLNFAIEDDDDGDFPVAVPLQPLDVGVGPGHGR